MRRSTNNVYGTATVSRAVEETTGATVVLWIMLNILACINGIEDFFMGDTFFNHLLMGVLSQTEFICSGLKTNFINKIGQEFHVTFRQRRTQFTPINHWAQPNPTYLSQPAVAAYFYRL